MQFLGRREELGVGTGPWGPWLGLGEPVVAQMAQRGLGPRTKDFICRQRRTGGSMRVAWAAADGGGLCGRRV